MIINIMYEYKQYTTTQKFKIGATLIKLSKIFHPLPLMTIINQYWVVNFMMANSFFRHRGKYKIFHLICWWGIFREFLQIFGWFAQKFLEIRLQILCFMMWDFSNFLADHFSRFGDTICLKIYSNQDRELFKTRFKDLAFSFSKLAIKQAPLHQESIFIKLRQKP